MVEHSKKEMDGYYKNIEEIRTKFANLTDWQRKFLVEAMSEIQGLVTAKFLGDAKELAQSVKDTVGPKVGIKEAVAVNRDEFHHKRDDGTTEIHLRVRG